MEKRKYDLSEKGREEFYTQWFKDYNEIINNTNITDKFKLDLINQRVNYLKSYNNQVFMYTKQLKELWILKKSHSKNSLLEMKLQCQLSKSTLQRGVFIANYEERLKKMSSTFEKDLKRIMDEDLSPTKEYLMNRN